MKKETLSKEAKTIELGKYKLLILATLDYYIENPSFHVTTPEFDSKKYYENLKIELEVNYTKGRLTKLKQWFLDLTEIFIEARDFRFNDYLKTKTDSDINILSSHYLRVNKIIESAKIKTDHQYHDIMNMVDYLCQSSQIDNEKLAVMNKLLTDYTLRKQSKQVLTDH